MRKTFPKVLAALRQVEQGNWALADALLIELGPPVGFGTKHHNGSSEQFKLCSRYLAAAGFHYHPGYLRRMRGVAHSWPPDRRIKGMRFWAHVHLTPELYERYMANVADDGQPPNVEQALQFRRSTRATPDVKLGRTNPVQHFHAAVREAHHAGQRAMALYDAHEQVRGEQVEHAVDSVVEVWDKLKVKAAHAPLKS